jgi:hypothetical protein
LEHGSRLFSTRSSRPTQIKEGEMTAPRPIINHVVLALGVALAGWFI